MRNKYPIPNTNIKHFNNSRNESVEHTENFSRFFVKKCKTRIGHPSDIIDDKMSVIKALISPFSKMSLAKFLNSPFKKTRIKTEQNAGAISRISCLSILRSSINYNSPKIKIHF